MRDDGKIVQWEWKSEKKKVVQVISTSLILGRFIRPSEITGLYVEEKLVIVRYNHDENSHCEVFPYTEPEKRWFAAENTIENLISVGQDKVYLGFKFDLINWDPETGTQRPFVIKHKDPNGASNPSFCIKDMAVTADNLAVCIQDVREACHIHVFDLKTPNLIQACQLPFRPRHITMIKHLLFAQTSESEGTSRLNSIVHHNIVVFDTWAKKIIGTIQDVFLHAKVGDRETIEIQPNVLPELIEIIRKAPTPLSWHDCTII